MSNDTKAIKLRIIEAGYKAVNHLVKVAEEDIINTESDNGDVSADKMKNAAAAKKLAIFDAFEILSRIEEEEKLLAEVDKEADTKVFKGFAEGRSK